MREKKVLITVGNVRIREYDSMNVQVERYEDVFVPKDRKTIKKWVFKGYSRGILSALLMIQRNELLVDKSLVNDLDSYVRQVEHSNRLILKAAKI